MVLCYSSLRWLNTFNLPPISLLTPALEKEMLKEKKDMRVNIWNITIWVGKIKLSGLDNVGAFIFECRKLYFKRM